MRKGVERRSYGGCRIGGVQVNGAAPPKRPAPGAAGVSCDAIGTVSQLCPHVSARPFGVTTERRHMEPSEDGKT
jgi:hypothetical protein